MKQFTTHTGLVGPMDRANVDTDMIIPKQFLKSIKRTGFGVNLFDELRYQDQGEPGQDNSCRPLNMDFPLNWPRYEGATILLTRKNFGCGSSREHAPWALEDYGFRVIIAPSYADIFYNNCCKNGLLPIVLGEDLVDKLFQEMENEVGYTLTVDLTAQSIWLPGGDIIAFEVAAFRKKCFLQGLDEIGLTLQHAEAITEFERAWRERCPWLFGSIR